MWTIERVWIPFLNLQRCETGIENLYFVVNPNLFTIVYPESMATTFSTPSVADGKEKISDPINMVVSSKEHKWWLDSIDHKITPEVSWPISRMKDP